jgi:hypothetical protein
MSPFYTPAYLRLRRGKIGTKGVEWKGFEQKETKERSRARGTDRFKALLNHLVLFPFVPFVPFCSILMVRA